ncbi:MAG: hypothetical protein M1820_009960 [Bogoriella megaspora]|nr:MAG: hypothetical protein M1820_009960 [Bogoriella megaspora]
MLPATSPTRPRPNPQSAPITINHQQIRHSTAIPIDHPRSQIEAMPPSPPRTHSIYNPSTLHPVFFTERLRKTPFPLPIRSRDVLQSAMGIGVRSPCAEGYVYEERGGGGKEGWAAGRRGKL